jgi:histone-lysine N-methyltransferase SETD1
LASAAPELAAAAAAAAASPMPRRGGRPRRSSALLLTPGNNNALQLASAAAASPLGPPLSLSQPPADAPSAFAIDAARWRAASARRKRLAFGRSRVHAWGMFAAEGISPGDFIAEYTGELVRLGPLLDLRERLHESRGLADYFFRISGTGWAADATLRGGRARFINHSCEPNAAARVFRVDGTTKVGIYARREIAPGEEVTYDYKFAREEDESRRIACRCGAKGCRGWMN